MTGTALHVRRFLLVEHPGPWGFDAIGTSGIASDVLESLVATTRSVGARTLLIRRHGRRRAGSSTRAWAVADIVGGGVTWGRWAEDADLLTARDALVDPPPGSHDPLLLVCAHGRHDACCAVRGRPVAAALEERWPDAVWECSHVGGDRFAANVVVLPEGTYYGDLGAGDAVDVVARHLAGAVVPERLRGFSRFPPVAQVAAATVHERFGPGAERDVLGAAVSPVAQDRWVVELRCTGTLPPRVEVDVVAHMAEPAVLTCQAPRATSARVYVVTAVRAGAAPSG